MQKTGAPLRVAIAGLGAVGLKLAEEIDKGIPGLKLVAASAKNIHAAKERLHPLNARPSNRLCETVRRPLC